VRTIVLRFGHGPLFWVHPHTVDMAAFFADDATPEWVQADLDLDPRTVGPRVVDADPAIRSAVIRFRNGITAQIVAAESNDVEIAGSGGIATIFSDGAGVEWRTRQGDRDGLIDAGHLLARHREENKDTVSGTVESVRTLIAAIRGEQACAYDLDIVTRNMEMLFGMVYSHLDEGRRIRWPIERRGWTITGRLGDRFV
jgi:scyllo-inositol 2-dehydrogenase (NAD+)